MRKRPSIRRISVHSIWLGFLVVAVLGAVMLPRFLKLETYRPAIQLQLQEATGREVTIGAIHAQFVPPSVTADEIVVFEMDPPHRPMLSAKRAVLRIRLKPLFRGSLKIRTAILEQAKWIIYSDRLTSGRTIKASNPSDGSRPTVHVVIQEGSIEFRGPLFGESVRWAIDNVEADIVGAEHRISLSARPSFLGPSARLDMTVDPQADPAIRAELKNAKLNSIVTLLGTQQAKAWKGVQLDARAEAKWPLTKFIDLHIERLTVPNVPGAFLKGLVQISTRSVDGNVLFSGLKSSMTAHSRLSWSRERWNLSSHIDRYSPEILPLFLDNRWAQSLDNPGSLVIAVSRRGAGPVQLSVTGSSFTFTGSRLEVPTWSATGDGDLLNVKANAQTSDGKGSAKIRWIQTSSAEPGRIEVNAESILAGDILDAFAVRPSTPIGIESLEIKEGLLRGAMMPKGRFLIENTEITLQDLTLKTTGEIDFGRTPARTHFVGNMTDVNLSSVLEHLGASPAPVSGIGNAAFDISFLADKHWQESLSGTIHAKCQDGFLRAGKLIYRVAGHLNLTNLLKPSAKSGRQEDGMPYYRASATVRANQGVLETFDLKADSEIMNLSGVGQINLPTETIDAKITLEFMNLVKDTLTMIPVIKTVIKADTGLVRIPLRLKGKLDNPNLE